MSLLEEELNAEADESSGAAATSPAALTAFRRGLSGVLVPIRRRFDSGRSRIELSWSISGSPVERS